MNHMNYKESWQNSPLSKKGIYGGANLTGKQKLLGLMGVITGIMGGFPAGIGKIGLLTIQNALGAIGSDKVKEFYLKKVEENLRKAVLRKADKIKELNLTNEVVLERALANAREQAENFMRWSSSEEQLLAAGQFAGEVAKDAGSTMKSNAPKLLSQMKNKASSIKKSLSSLFSESCGHDIQKISFRQNIPSYIDLIESSMSDDDMRDFIRKKRSLRHFPKDK